MELWLIFVSIYRKSRVYFTNTNEWHLHCKGTYLATRVLPQSWCSLIENASLFPGAEHSHRMSLKLSIPCHYHSTNRFTSFEMVGVITRVHTVLLPQPWESIDYSRFSFASTRVVLRITPSICRQCWVPANISLPLAVSHCTIHRAVEPSPHPCNVLSQCPLATSSRIVSLVLRCCLAMLSRIVLICSLSYCRLALSSRIVVDRIVSEL